MSKCTSAHDISDTTCDTDTDDTDMRYCMWYVSYLTRHVTQEKFARRIMFFVPKCFHNNSDIQLDIFIQILPKTDEKKWNAAEGESVNHNKYQAVISEVNRVNCNQ